MICNQSWIISARSLRAFLECWQPRISTALAELLRPRELVAVALYKFGPLRMCSFWLGDSPWGFDEPSQKEAGPSKAIKICTPLPLASLHDCFACQGSPSSQTNSMTIIEQFLIVFAQLRSLYMLGPGGPQSVKKYLYFNIIAIVMYLRCFTWEHFAWLSHCVLSLYQLVTRASNNSNRPGQVPCLLPHWPRWLASRGL